MTGAGHLLEGIDMSYGELLEPRAVMVYFDLVRNPCSRVGINSESDRERM